MSLAAIHVNAQLVLDHLRDLSGLGTRFGYNRESLVWVEGFIDRLHNSPQITPEKQQNLIQISGSFLGECVIHEYGGSWKQNEGQWGIFFDDRNAVFPFSKMTKLFEGGVASGDSIVGFLDIIPEIFKRD